MVYQQDLDLHKPLNKDLPPNIRRTQLSPRLALSALTLHGDLYRQLQSRCNASIFWHPVTQLFMQTVLGLTLLYQYSELWEISDTWGEFATLVWNNKYLVTSMFPSLIFVAGMVGLVSFLLTDELRTVSDRLAGDAYQSRLFKFPLKIFANANGKEYELNTTADFMNNASESTELIEYRESPVAVVTVIPLPDESSRDVFYAKISGLHVRKSYAKAGLQNDLLDIAIEKAKKLALRYIKDNNIKKKNIKTVLLCDAYTFDSINKPIIEQKGFEEKSRSTQLDPFAVDKKPENFLYLIPDSLVKKFFGIYRNTYQLVIDGDEVSIATGSATTDSKARMRRT
ncbi:hypothetical_protein [Candidozyma auris]|uniref:hypothetical_protein n=1 Tax=Candidozyma auris TaxID=498019 RepID=UPI000D2CBF39|nr:hypothetical_protein [[Candida] auris]QEO23075.1 hypothetical_protein [[Candida] auris]GBL49122.1 hypothetical protein CAJCM15448_13960 [[Candida] auris]